MINADNGNSYKEKPHINTGGDFKKLVTESSIFADKSLFIKEVLETSSEVMLIAMPRRWGKSCNLDMLERFLEINTDDNGKQIKQENTDNYKLFSGGEINLGINKIKKLSPLNIANRKIELRTGYIINALELQGQYPVIYVDFKDCYGDTAEEVKDNLREVLRASFAKHKYLTKSLKIEDYQKEEIKGYLIGKINDFQIRKGLKFLSELLYKHHGKKSWILIDEYDAGANYAYRKKEDDVTETIVKIFREIYSSALKNNDYMEKGVLTGVQYIAQSGMLSGLNNFTKKNITNYRYSQYYGLDNDEVDIFCKHFGFSEERIEMVKYWYNGYRLKTTLDYTKKADYVDKYNIWSVVNYLNNPESGLVSYWEKSGSIDSIKPSFKQELVKKNLEILVNGGDIAFRLKSDFSIDDFRVLQEINCLEGNKAINTYGLNILFSYLFITGYLTLGNNDGLYKLPNKEIRYEMGNEILEYYETIYNIDPFKLKELTNVLQSVFDDSGVARFIRTNFASNFQSLNY